MKGVILDGYTLNPGDLDWTELERLCDLTVYDRTAYSEKGVDLIIERVGDAEIVFTNKTPLPAKVFIGAPNIRFVGVLATGYNVVDIDAAREKNVVVTNIPTYGTAAVAQMAIALLLEVCHHVGAHDSAVKNGAWASGDDWCFWNYPLIELAEKTMGIVGFGRIGRQTAKVADALGMDVIAFDQYRGDHFNASVAQFAELDDLFARSDVISLHVPLSNATSGMINARSIAKMKRGAILINTSRGQLIVEEELAEALNSGRIGGAALDVVSTEPIREANPLLTAKNCILTPHIAWAPKESRQRLLDAAVENLSHFLSGAPVNVVNERI